MSSQNFLVGVPAPTGVQAPFPYALTEEQEFNVEPSSLELETHTKASQTQLETDTESESATQVDPEIAQPKISDDHAISSHEPPSRRWIVLAVSTLGGLLVSLQSSALIVALPDLMNNLHINFTTIIWVLLSYSLALTAVVPVLGYLGDSGIKGVRCLLFNVGFLTFTIGSFLCGWAQPQNSGYDLVGYRTIQGTGGALVFANCFAIVADKFYMYNQVGLATGIINIAFAAGSILGPVIGGATTQTAWYWVFFFNVPFGVVGTILGFIYAKDHIPSNAHHVAVLDVVKRFDFIGFGSLTLGITLLFIVIVSSLFVNGVLSSQAALISMGVITGLCLIVFFVQDGYFRGAKRRTKEKKPFVNFTLFKNWIFTNTVVVGGFAGGIARTNLTFAMIFFFQGPYKQNPLFAGVMLIPFGLGVMVGGLPSGRLADIYGYRYLCVIGLAIASVGNLALPLALHPDTNYWSIAGMLLVLGLGWGLYNSPSASISMLCIEPHERASSSSLRMMFTMLAQMISIVLVFDLIVGSLPMEALIQLFIIGGGIEETYLESFMSGFRVVMWISVAITALVGLLAITLPVKAVISNNKEAPVTSLSAIVTKEEEART